MVHALEPQQHPIILPSMLYNPIKPNLNSQIYSIFRMSELEFKLGAPAPEAPDLPMSQAASLS